MLRAARRLEKSNIAKADATIASLAAHWVLQDIDSAAGRLDAFINGTPEEVASARAKQCAKERKDMAAIVRPDMDLPEHWLNWEIRMIGAAREAEPQVAPIMLAAEMVALIERATEPTPTGFHGRSQLMELSMAISPRSEATTMVHEGHQMGLATAQVRAIVGRDKRIRSRGGGHRRHPHRHGGRNGQADGLRGHDGRPHL